jgi:hypothetical protein
LLVLKGSGLDVKNDLYSLVKHVTEIIVPVLFRNNAPLKPGNIADVTPCEIKIPVLG